MSIDRLSDVQERLERLYKLLKGLETAKDKAEDSEKPRIQLKIDTQWQEIHAAEQEYAQRIGQKVKRQDLPEAEAEVIVCELVDELELMQPRNDKTQELLLEILTELRKPGVPASAKLKVAIPIVPNIVTYEIEGDTESVVRRLFPTFMKMHDKLKVLTAGDIEKK